MDKIIIKENPNISVIVPVYNVEKYLGRCLDSIFNQEFLGSFEVIAVEDGSTDSSLQILKNYQVKEPRLKIIEHGINKKLSIARATGMNSATGDYIMHVDSDDCLLPFALKKLYAKCIETNADVLVYNYVIENNTGYRTFVKSIKEQLITTNKLSVQQHFFGSPWNKIVKRFLVDNLISGQIGINHTEDLLNASEILLKARKICLIPESHYVYFSNIESLTNVIKSEEYLSGQIKVLSQLQKIILYYKANQKFTENILKYFEKFIYLEIAKNHFWHKENLTNSSKLVKELFQFPIMSQIRVKRLKSALTYKLVSLYEVKKRFGIRMAIGIILRSFQR